VSLKQAWEAEAASNTGNHCSDIAPHWDPRLSISRHRQRIQSLESIDYMNNFPPLFSPLKNTNHILDFSMGPSKTLHTLNLLRKNIINSQVPFRTIFPHRSITSSSTAISQRLSGKTILITGASSGIGRATALEFARTSPSSLRLILTARRLDALEKLAKEIKEEVGDGVKVLPVKLDVSDAGEIKSFVGGLGERNGGEWGGVDVLVNNAYVSLNLRLSLRSKVVISRG
jgi:hypothetical protein